MPTKSDLEAFKKDLAASLERNREAFEGLYADQLCALSGLSQSEIDMIAPNITTMQKYEELIAVVKQASRHNLAQAQLKDHILKLGDVAVKIAKHVPSLAGLFKA